MVPPILGMHHDVYVCQHALVVHGCAWLWAGVLFHLAFFGCIMSVFLHVFGALA